MATSKIKSDSIDSIDAAKVPNLDASKITTGTIADARVSASAVTQHVTATDLSPLENDLAVLALHNAINTNLTAHGLQNSWIEQFEDGDSIVTTSAVRDSSEYVYSGTLTPTSWPYTADADQEIVNSGSSFADVPTTYDWITINDPGNPAQLANASAYLGYWASPSNYATSQFYVDYLANYTWTGAKVSFSSQHGHVKLWRIEHSTDGTNWTILDQTGSTSADWDITPAFDLPNNFTIATDATGVITNGNPGNSPSDGGGIITFGTPITARYLKISAGGYYSNANANCGFDAFIPIYNASSVNSTGSFTSTTITPQDSASKSSLGLVILYKNASGTNALNSDIICKVSADNGSNYSTCVLASKGTFSTGINIAMAPAISVTAGTQLKYKVEFANQSANTGTTKTVTAVGNTQHSTAQNKIGSSSIYFDGSGSFRDGVNTNADRITVPDSNDWHFPANQCTIDFWIRAASVNGYNGAKSMGLMSHNPSGADPVQNWEFYINGNGKGAFLPIGSGLTGTTTLTDNTWHHLAIVYDGSVIKLYVDGTSEASRSATSGLFGNVATTLNIGSMYSASGDFTGYMDEIRISNIARWSTSSFTPSTTAYTADANTLLLLHSDTTNASTTFADSSSITGKSAQIHGVALQY